MNTNDLPPAARLAALIEAGRAANPDLHQRQGSIFLKSGATCALGFACLGAGIERGYLVFEESLRRGNWKRASEAVGINLSSSHLSFAVAGMNDRGASLDEICRSLREGELAQIECHK